MVTNLLSQATILIDERCKNMCIADLFTAHCDSLTELNARGKNVKVSHKRRAHVFVALLHKPALGNLVPVCIKGYLQMTKVVTMLRKKHIRLSFR